LPPDIATVPATAKSSTAPAIPGYLTKVYWWAYVHPRAVQVFERQWLVNAILWGNFRRLREAALDALGKRLPGRTLQIACVYGDLTQKLLDRVPGDGFLDVADILPVQLENLGRKLKSDPRLQPVQSDSSQLQLPTAHYDRALLFFLLHEQPLDVRRATLSEALRVIKPGGTLVVVDYHQPRWWHPLYWPMKAVLAKLEPFALDLWRHDVCEWLPAAHATADANNAPTVVQRMHYFGGLYQLIEFRV
jgi:ubiquinone/menaquinone biosynthesis C-methylase UbiE